MKHSVYQLLLAGFFASLVSANPSEAQEILSRPVTIQVANQELRTVLAQLHQQADIRFTYSSSLIASRQRVTYSATNRRLSTIMDDLFKPLSIGYRVEGRRVVLFKLDKPDRSSLNILSPNQPSLPNAEAPDQTAPLDQTISGKVTDESGNGMPGVSIVLKGTQRGTTSNNEGNYSIAVPNGNAVLVFSFVGYLSQEVVVGNRSSVNVSLAVDNKSLSEVVVVGYGSQIKKEVTGSISTLDAKQLEDQPVGQFAQKIQGRLAGVQINQTTGKPGEGLAFRIRGAASVNAGNNPLFVVDGMPIVGNINQINPNEIENFSVLKDASASALYGSRAANGVVLITTKQGKSGKTLIDFNASYGVQQVPQRGRPDFMNATEWAQFQKEILEDKAKYEGYTGGIPAAFQNPAQYGEGTNWYNVLLNNNAPTSNYNLSISTGKDKFSSATTLGYFRQEGAIVNTDFQRFSLRSNNQYNVNDNLKLGINIAPSYQSGQNFNTDQSLLGILFAAMTTPPTESPYNPDGSLRLTITGPPGIFTFTTPNWLRQLKETKDRTNSINLLASTYAELTFLKDFRFKTSVNVDFGSSARNFFRPSTAGGIIFEAPPLRAIGEYSNRKYSSWLLENTLTYTKSVGKHNLEALAGYSAQKYNQEYANIFGIDFPDDNIPWIDAAATKNGGSNTTQWSLLSLIGRVNYNYQGKYLLSAAVRQDGSSRFGDNKRFGTFPSISAGWIVSDESFFSGLGNAVSYLKLRASYGLTGNFNIGNFNQYGGIGPVNYVFGNAIAQGRAQTSLGNPDLTWETTKQADVGIDASFLADRLNVSLDYYNKRTSNLLYQVDIPRASGFGSVQSNVGEFSFWGYEAAITSRNTVGRLKWTSDFNISLNRSKVIQLGTNNTPIGALSSGGYMDFWRTEVNQPIGQFYGFVFDGIYKNQEEFSKAAKHVTSAVGTVRFKDLNNDGIIDDKDRTFIGNPNPKFLYGFNNSFTYDNFDLTLAVNGAVGGKVFNDQMEWGQVLVGFFNVYSNVKDRWRSEQNPGAGLVPSTRTGTEEFARQSNTRYISDASYLKLQNITLGYTLPVLAKYARKIRVYGTVQNAFILTKYQGANPEVSANGLNGLQQGADVTAYPITRVVSLGLNVGF